MLFFLLTSTFAVLAFGEVIENQENGSSEEVKALVKRQAVYYYLCGTYPNQYYSTVPCQTSATCPNGGRKLGVGCSQAYQCTPYSTGPVQCINGCCCSASTAPPTNNNFGVCFSGQLSQVTCTTRSQCQAGQTCINGLCCTTTGNEYTAACGGLAATGSCTNGGCAGGLTCTSSNYCCECQWGRTSGRCNNGACPAGYSCNAGGYCCATCPNRASPYGACSSTGTCGGGTTCRTGNICC